MAKSENKSKFDEIDNAFSDVGQKYKIPAEIIANLRFLADRKMLASKIKSGQCQCGVGSQGKLGKRDPKTGLVEVNFETKKTKTSIKCFDIGIGKLGVGSKVIAFIPVRKSTGFVDYKG